MHDRLLALAVGATLAAAVPAYAQMSSMPGPSSSMGSWGHSQDIPNDQSLPQDFVKKLTALSYKIVAIRAQDGGKLRPEHLASLQQELLQLKRQYRVTSDLRVNAG